MLDRREHVQSIGGLYICALCPQINEQIAYTVWRNVIGCEISSAYNRVL